MNTGFCDEMEPMTAAHTPPVPSLAEAAQWTPEQIVELARANADLRRDIELIKHQLEWFKRQIFGQKSEKRAVAPLPGQMPLGELPIAETAPPVPGKLIPAHTRQPIKADHAKSEEDSGLFFDEKRVPVETIAVANPEIEGLSPDQYEVIGEKVSHRLAQRPGSYVVLKYVRPVIKRLDIDTIHCAPAPVGVIEGSRADESFIAAC